MAEIIVGVRFQRPSPLHVQNMRVYNYKTDQQCKVGDMAVVMDINGLLKIVEIAEVPSKHVYPAAQTKWLVDIVNMEGYIERIS